MGNIKVLKENVSSKIAAGEVIEKPVSVVKELVENSIDANSKNIFIEIAEGGKKLIRVVDDGIGIRKEDIKLAFERHATSKIYTIKDIFNIQTLGFRGEALASIASVSNVEIVTKTHNEQVGTKCILNGGTIQSIEEAPRYRGCSITVRNLFFNTPARLKFLNSDTKEASYITNFITKLAIGRPDISFKLINNKKEIFYSSGNGDLREVIAKIYGIDIAKSLIPIEAKSDACQIRGYISPPQYSRGNRSGEIFFVNKRFIKNQGLELTLDRAYKTFLTKGRFPISVIFIDIDPSKVDVNVHPSKIEVKFQDEQQVQKNVFDAVRNALNNSILIPNERLTNTNSSDSKVYNDNKKEPKKCIKENVSANEYFTNKYDKISSNRFKDKRENKLIKRPTKQAKQEVIQQQIPTMSSTRIYKPTPSNTLKTKQKNAKVNSQTKKLNIEKVIGQLFNTYIVAESRNKLYLIDHHAAHERILFERYLKSVDIIAGSQQLVTPYTLRLTTNEMLLIEELGEYLKTMGFDISIFGKDTILIRSVPYYLDKTFEPSMLRNAIDTLNNNEFIGLNLKERFAASLACHTAIRAGKSLTSYEIKELLDLLEKTDNPYTCPHGRPTIISIDQYELEKKFKRIQ